MSQNTRTFWVTFAGVSIPLAIAIGSSLWAISGWVNIQEDRLTQIDRRVSTLEHADKVNRDVLVEIRNDVKWIINTSGVRRTEGYR